MDKSRSHWALMGAIVASTALAPKLEALRIAVPGETRLARASAASAQPEHARPVAFSIPPGPLGDVLVAIERVSGLTIAIAEEGIASLPSNGVSGPYTPLQAVMRALDGTSVTARVTAPKRVTVEIRLASEAVDVTAATPLPRPASPKYSRPLTETPQTIEVIPRQLMEAQGITTLSEALRNVPGISLQAGEGGGASNTSGDMFNLRGFSANNSVFVDGVRDDGLMSRDVFNLEQIEVFMGPTGSDVGRGNAAGYVNMQTKVPHGQSAYAVSYRYGSADQNRTTVDLNQTLPMGSRDSWFGQTAVRVNALWEDGGVPGRDFVTRKNQSVAPSVAFGLNTPTRVTAAAQITRQDNVPDYGIPGSAWSEYPLAPTTVIAKHAVDRRNFYGSVGYDSDRVEQESYTARVERDLNNSLTLRNQARYNRTHRTAVISTLQSPASFLPDTETVVIARQGNERRNQILSNQTSLSARFVTGGVRHEMSAGIEAASEEQFAPALGGLGTREPVSVNIYHPNPHDPVVGFNPARTGAFNRGRTNSVGAYAFDTLDLGSRWQLSAGVRWERYHAAFLVKDASGAVTTDLEAQEALVSGKAGVLFRLTDSANLYFSYGSAIAPPGAGNFTLSAQPNNQNNPNVRPQESTHYEIGGKAALAGGRLSLGAAAFRTDNRNVIFTVDASAIPPVFNQDDQQRVHGVSLSSLGQITSRWQVLASLGYLDASQISQNPALNGKRLTLTPELSGSVWTTFDLRRGVTVGGGVRYASELFVNAANTIRVPGYALADAMVEYDVNTHLSLRINVYNLTDRAYIRNVNNNGGRFNPGTPRSAALTSSVRF